MLMLMGIEQEMQEIVEIGNKINQLAVKNMTTKANTKIKIKITKMKMKINHITKIQTCNNTNNKMMIKCSKLTKA